MAVRKKQETPRKAPVATKRGGARAGAGRKKGSGTGKLASTKAIAKAAEGESPIEYMLRTMRQADDDLLDLEKSGAIETAERIKLQAARNQRRDWAAQAAAPYVHPRLSSIEANLNHGLQESWLEQLD